MKNKPTNLADLALNILHNSDKIYTVTSPSFDEVPAMSLERAKELVKSLTASLDNSLLHGILLDDSPASLEDFSKTFYEKNGRLNMRRTYQTNKPPKSSQETPNRTKEGMK